MYSHSVPLSNSVVTGCKPKSRQVFVCSDFVERENMICDPFIAFEGVTFACTWLLTWTFPPKEKTKQKRNNLNCGRIIAGLPKLHQFLLVALRSDNIPDYTVTTSACATSSRKLGLRRVETSHGLLRLGRAGEAGVPWRSKVSTTWRSVWGSVGPISPRTGWLKPYRPSPSV